jgi:inner membrane protein
MFIFGHIGITLGAAILVSGIVDKFPHAAKSPDSNPAQREATATPFEKRRSFAETIGLKSLTEFLDIRVLILGTILPDIIDKPLEFLNIGDGRMIAHTLLITLVILITGFYVYLNHKKTWVLAISIGMVTHLLLDQMWQTPQVLFWPLFGWAFPTSDHIFFYKQIFWWWNAFIKYPAVKIPEFVGLGILLASTIVLIGQGRLKSLLVKGKM